MPYEEIPPAPHSTLCAQCGGSLAFTTRFCPHCGTAASSGKPLPPPPPPPPPPRQSDPIASSDIATLKAAVAAHPEDESYSRLLAMELHDDAMRDWWTDPDGVGRCVSHAGLVRAKMRLGEAQRLRLNDPSLQQKISRLAAYAHAEGERKFAGSWAMVVILGFFYVLPGVLWWYVNRRPRYLLNHDYMLHTQSGKASGAAARMGGLQGKIYDFFSESSDAWGWLFGLVFMFTAGLVLSPIFMIIAYKENYLDPAKESSSVAVPS